MGVCVCVCLHTALCVYLSKPVLTFILTPTLTKQTLECLPSERDNESVLTRNLTVIALVMTD